MFIDRIKTRVLKALECVRRGVLVSKRANLEAVLLIAVRIRQAGYCRVTCPLSGGRRSGGERKRRGGIHGAFPQLPGLGWFTNIVVDDNINRAYILLL